MRSRGPSEFARRVVSAVRRIPAGRVATYGDIAEMAGSPRAWRAVGAIMRECRDPSIPAHRVIASAGALGGYGGNLQLKRELLRAEGHEVGVSRVRHFSDVRWRATNGTKTKVATKGTKATKIKKTKKP
jgi:O-6-methylguanine DNA methyltransferase